MEEEKTDMRKKGRGRRKRGEEGEEEDEVLGGETGKRGWKGKNCDEEGVGHRKGKR